MSHFYERILNKELSFRDEINKLVNIFKYEKNYFWETEENESLYSYINKEHFRLMDVSYNYANMNEYFEDAISDAKNDIEAYILYCEAVYTVINQLINSNRRLDSHDINWANNQIKCIKRIVSTNTGKMNLVPKEIQTEIGVVTTFIPNDSLLEKTLEEVNDENIERYLIEYSSSRTNGNVNRKTEILKLLSTTVEGITKVERFRNKYKQLCSNTDLMYNKLDLRHNVDVKDKRYFEKTLSEREKWLDLVFRETLLVLNLPHHLSDTEEIEKLKQSIENQNNKGEIV